MEPPPRASWALSCPHPACLCWLGSPLSPEHCQAHLCALLRSLSGPLHHAHPLPGLPLPTHSPHDLAQLPIPPLQAPSWPEPFRSALGGPPAVSAPLAEGDDGERLPILAEPQKLLPLTQAPEHFAVALGSPRGAFQRLSPDRSVLLGALGCTSWQWYPAGTQVPSAGFLSPPLSPADAEACPTPPTPQPPPLDSAPGP